MLGESFPLIANEDGALFRFPVGCAASLRFLNCMNEHFLNWIFRVPAYCIPLTKRMENHNSRFPPDGIRKYAL